MANQTIEVRLIRSTIGQAEKTKRIVQALGLSKIGSQNSLKDNNCIRGMVNKVRHLVDYKISNG